MISNTAASTTAAHKHVRSAMLDVAINRDYRSWPKGKKVMLSRGVPAIFMLQRCD
jgi:hypothetical protein